MKPWFNLIIICSILLFLGVVRYNSTKPQLASIKSYLKTSPVFNVPVYVNFAEPGFRFPDLIQAAQSQVDYELQRIFAGTPPIHITLVDNLHKTYNESDVDKYQINLILSNENSVAVDSDFLAAFVFYDLATIHANDLPFYLTQSVVYHLLSPDIELLLQGFDHPFEYAQDFLVSLVTSPPLSPQLLQNVTNQLSRFVAQLAPVANVSLWIDSPKEAPPGSISIHYNHHFGEEFADDAVSEMVAVTKMQIKTILGIPENPSNNIPLKLISLARYKSLHGLISCLDLLQAAPKQDPAMMAQFRRSLFMLIDKLTQVNDSNDWLALLQETSLLFNSLSVI